MIDLCAACLVLAFAWDVGADGGGTEAQWCARRVSQIDHHQDPPPVHH